MKKIGLIILKISILVLCFLSFLSDSIFGKETINIFTFANSILGIFLGILMILNISKDEHPRKWMIITAFLLSMFIEIGICFEKGFSLRYFWKSTSNILMGIFNILFLSIYLAYLILFLSKIFKNLCQKEKHNKIIDFIFYKHPFISTFIIVLTMSIIYLIIYYPGTMNYDGRVQLLHYYHEIPFTNHHPAFLTLFMGGLMDLGRFLGSDNLGIFFFVLIQVIINALVYAYVILIMSKMNTSLFIKIITLFFYAFFPLLNIYSIVYQKDTLFFLVCLFTFVYTYYHFKINYNRNDKKKFIVLEFLYLALYLLRNTGFYLVLIITLSFILYYFKKDKLIFKMFILLFILNIGLNYTYHNMFLKKLNIEEAGIGEMLSIPIQQIGRYVLYYDDFKEREIKILNNVFDNNYSKISFKYNPILSDNMKGMVKKHLNNKELIEFFKVWLVGFKRHPFIYIDATLNNIYAYFYPNYLNADYPVEGYYNLYNFKNSELYFERGGIEKAQVVLQNFASTLTKAPFFSLLYMPSFYTFIFIICVSYLIASKKENELIFLIPLFMIILFCLVSPINGHLRYLMPLVVAVPFLLAIFNINLEK